ncbi:MAG: asparaginase, partial [Nitriliruptorales bacterium]
MALADTTRRDGHGHFRVESSHCGHLVVVTPDGQVAALGDPDRVTFVRSAAKPFQAAACLELLPDGLPSDLLAVGWASHTAEPEHLAAVTALLALAGLRPEQVTTPSLGTGAGRLAYNCSGKHALFALAGHTLGERGPQLLDPGGSLQRHVLARLRSALGEPAGLGVDGCGAP